MTQWQYMTKCSQGRDNIKKTVLNSKKRGDTVTLWKFDRSIKSRRRTDRGNRALDLILTKQYDSIQLHHSGYAVTRRPLAAVYYGKLLMPLSYFSDSAKTKHVLSLRT